MKKALLLLASAALLFAGCAKEQIAGQQDGELTNVTLTANLDNGTTKADADGDGLADNVNRCIMEIYYGDELFARQYAPVNDKTATFTAQVVSNRQYTVAFWADNVDELATDKYYTTTSLKEIAINGSYIGNDDARDAFYVCEPFTVQQAGGSFTATLKRPFAQMNVITTDWDKAASVAGLAPETVKVTLKNVMTGFNAVTGEISAAQDIVYEAAVYTPAANGAEKTISMDYIFASDEKAAIDIDWKALHGTDANVEHSFTAIPYQRNYRTNIKGALLTSQGQWTVEVKPQWNQPDEVITFAEAGSIAAANEAFANGATSVKITSVGEETTLYLPQTTKEISIDFANPSETITVKYGPAPVALTKAAVAEDKPAVVNIATNDITKFTVTGINNIVWLAGNQAALANALTNATNKQTVALANDITMSGEWTPVTSKYNSDGGHYYGTFDGRNHTISNLKVTDYTGTYVGFFSHVSGATIKNVTFKNATLTNAESLGGNARGAVIAGWSYACNIDNCHVINSSVTGCQKVGGILGSMSVEGAAGLNSVTNCSVDGLTISCNIENDLFQSGALIGYIQFVNANPDGILIENNSVKDITFNDDSSDYGNVGYYNGTFIGTISRKQQVDGQKIVLNNNTISGTNTELFKTIYSSPYFGWATNAENYSGAIAPILIDGVEWTPNYPVKNVTKGTSYPTLAKAVEAASAGDEITLENGEYTLPSLSNIIINGIGDNVVVNHSAGSICATSNVTIKNVVFNLGQNGYHGFQHASNLVLDGCTFNGFMTTYGSTTYKNCTFNQDTYAYNMNAYGAEIVCENCVFNGKGKAVYVYDEGNKDMYHISFNNCVFNEVVGDRTACKAAILVKENVAGQKYVVNINGCEANFDKYVPDDPDYTGSSLWNMEIADVTGTDVTVNLDNEKVYPFTSFKVSDADGLRRAVKLFNKGKENTEYTIELADGTYSVSDLHIKQADGENKNPRSLLIKATNKGQVVLTPNADTKTHMIFIVSGCSNYYGSEYITFDGLKFSMPTNPGNGVASHAIYCPREPAKDPIGKLLGEEVSRYAHNINVINCELQGFGTADNSLLNAPQAAGINHVTVDGCVVNNAGYVVNGYFVDTKVLNSKVTNVKACANTNSQGITVENCEISAWNDYCIRSNGGPIIVKNNKFDMTFNGAIKVDEPAAIVYLRGANAPVEATISGNTITKAKIEMWDCYCATAWTVNGEAKAAGTGINF